MSQEPLSLISLFERRVNLSGSSDALRHWRDGAWHTLSWRAWWEQSERLAAGLIALGVAPGDRVALLAQTRMEWALLDVAILMAGAVVVPLYPSSLAHPSQELLRHAGCRVAIVEDPLQAQKLLPMMTAPEEADSPRLDHLILIDGATHHVGSSPREHISLDITALDPDDTLLAAGRLLELDALMSRGRRALAEPANRALARRRAITSETLATLVYTSGTQGEPRGVRLTHGEMMAELQAVSELALLDERDVNLMALPLAHIFARAVMWVGVFVGAQTAFARSLERVMEDMREVSPTFFAGVPHLFENIQRQVMQRVEGIEASWVKRALRQSLVQAREVSRIKQRHGDRPRGVARLLERGLELTLYARARALFGGRLRFFISGGAPLSVEVAEFFHAFDVLILEGYGLTETCAAITLNTPRDFRFGSVGRPLPGVDVTIADDGEILVRAPMCSQGYFMGEGEGASLIDERGWLHTGDLGRFDRDGYLYINGRLKDIIVTSGGKNIAPFKTERALERSPLVGRAVVFGDRRHYLTALFTLDRQQVEAWAKQHGVEVAGEDDASRWEALSSSEAVRRALEAHVEEVNETLASHESIRKFAVLDTDFTLDAGELTPTLKLRRATVEARYQHVLEGLYGSSGAWRAVTAR